MQKYKVIELLKEMTLDEKIGQMIQLTGEIYLNKEESITTGPCSHLHIPNKMTYKIGSILNANGAKETIEIQTRYLSRSRLKIPLLFMSDVINGYKTDLPIPLAQGCSWNVDLIKQFAQVAMKEASVAGVNVNYSPMIDLVRDARWGRVMESTCGEDSYLGEVYGKAMVEAYQGEDVSKEGKGVACIKHFAAYGAAESGRDYNTVDMSERELRQYYLPGYQAAMKAGAKMVMTSFNTVKGIPSSANQWLLRKVLREGWGFDGMIISDYSAIEETINHGVSENRKEASYKAITAGVDIDMMSNCYMNYLRELVMDGRISETSIDEAVLRILNLKNELGLFEHPYGHASVEKERQYFLCKEHRDIARKGVAETFVLLKNQGNILPLDKKQKIALIGPYGDNIGMSGAWSIYVDRSAVVTIKQAFEKRLGKGNFLYAKGSEILRQEEINPILEAEGAKLVTIEKEEEEQEKKKIEEAVTVAKKSDIIILAIGEHYKQSGEASSRASLDLPQGQQNLLNRLYELGKPMIGILFGGRPIIVKNVAEKVDALLEVWFPGTEGGDAIVDVLLGEVNPSGKLIMSFPQSVGQCPIYYNHYNTGRPNRKNVKFESRYQDIPTKSYYPFGYGLSYAKFHYKEMVLNTHKITQEHPITAKVRIKNESNIGGYEIVQLYIQDLYASVVRPVKELKGFQKIYFKPQEEKEVSFTITTDMLKFWNEELEYVIEPGKFKLYIGTNSEDTLQAEFEY